MDAIQPRDLNLDPAVLEKFAEFLKINEDVKAAVEAPVIHHNSNNDFHV